MFFGLLRKSNLFTNSQSFDPKKQLTRESFFVDSERKCLNVQIRWAKNNQFQKRIQTISLPSLAPHPLCPVTAIIQAFQLVGIQGPKAQAFPLTSHEFSASLKLALGSRPELTSHSFRRGGATWALENGVPGEIIKVLGDWQSSAYLCYVDQIPKSTVDFYRQKCFSNLPV
jgi:integrase